MATFNVLKRYNLTVRYKGCLLCKVWVFGRDELHAQFQVWAILKNAELFVETSDGERVDPEYIDMKTFEHQIQSAASAGLVTMPPPPAHEK